MYRGHAVVAMKTVPVVALVLVLAATTSASPSTGHWAYKCDSGNYTAPSKYLQSVEEMSAVLPREASSSPTLSHMQVIGSSQEDRVYALATCHGDTDADDCKRCLTQAFQDARAVCTFRKRVSIYYDTCSLGFSEKNITYRSKDLQAAYRADGPQVPAQCKEFNKAASALISDVARKAVDARYASGEEDLDEHGCTYKLYGFAECSPQIPAAQCQLCLEDLTAVPGLSGHVGERKATLWCTYRFEPYLFFKTSKGGHRTLWIVLGVVGGAVIIALIALIFLLWWRMPERKLVKDLVNRALTSFSDLKVTHGKKVLEVRPKADFNKGHAVNYLLECLVNKNNWDSTQVLAIYIGDDRTDEDAFKVLSGHGGFGILVSKKRRSTDALYSLRNPRQVKEFLQKLVTWNNGEAPVGTACLPGLGRRL